ncbi:hypothetical protein [Paracoccus alkenifer]|uniref:hypothetical protein n=1 Tax=Paracoccus alkenifer TaxID=65735 RepID=UPI00115FE5C2|nr:hypothetical protein [Paracoccus alkenifer]
MNDKAENNLTDSVAYNNPKTGRFQPGNPGKPRGARTKFSQATLQEIVSMKDDAVAVLRNRIAAGDGDAARWVLERIVGKSARFVELSGVTPEAIGQDLQDGALTVDEAKDVALAVSRLAGIERIAQLEERLDELTRLLKGTSL